MNKRTLYLLFAAAFWSLTAWGQQVRPRAYVTDSLGFETETTEIKDGQAPLDVIFKANPTDMEGYSPSYEWHFRKEEKSGGQHELFVRYEEDTQYTFLESGTYNVVALTRLEQGGDYIDSTAISISIAESRLEFPNAISPNGDGRNDDLKPKEGWKSIVKFHAIILNRWGQKIYEWFDPAGKWDGKHNGHYVKDGVYFLLVSAKGADGKEYNIRQDINVIKGYSEGGRSSGNQ